jgi:hypothetical protein
MNYAMWIRRNGFILGLILAVVLAFLFPTPGSRNGFLHPELVNNVRDRGDPVFTRSVAGI